MKNTNKIISLVTITAFTLFSCSSPKSDALEVCDCWNQSTVIADEAIEKEKKNDGSLLDAAKEGDALLSLMEKQGECYELAGDFEEKYADNADGFEEYASALAECMQKNKETYFNK